MSLKVADHLKVAAMLKSAGVFTMGAAAAECRTLAQAISDGASDMLAIKVGDSGVGFGFEDTSGNWFTARCHIDTTTQITVESVVSSSAGGTTMPTLSGTITAYNAALAGDLAKLLSNADTQDVTGIATVTSVPAGAYVLLFAADGTPSKILASNLGVSGGGTTPSDTTAPTVSSAQVPAASPAVIQITMSESMAQSIPPASAFAVSGGKTVTGVTISGAVVSLAVSGAYVSTDTITVSYTKPSGNPRLQDLSSNATESFGPVNVTNKVAAAGTSGSVQYPRMVDLSGSHASETGPAPYDYVTDFGAPMSGLLDLGFVAGQDGWISFTTPENGNDLVVGLTTAKVAGGSAMRVAVEAGYYAPANGWRTYNNGTPSASLSTRVANQTTKIARVGDVVTVSQTNNGVDWTTLNTYSGVTGAYKIQLISQYAKLNDITGSGLG